MNGPSSIAPPPDSRLPGSLRPLFSERPASRESLIDWLAGLVVSSTVAALALLGADRVFRPDWDFRWSDHWLGSLLLFPAAATWLALLWSIVVFGELGLTRRYRWSFRRRRRARAAFHGLLFGVFAWSTARLTFSGNRISQTVFAYIGPPLFELGVILGVAYFVWLVIGLERRTAQGQRKPALMVGIVLCCLAALPIWADMTLYVSLYEELHRMLEVSAFALLFTGIQLIGFALLRRFPGLRWVSRGVGGVLVAYAVTYAASPRLRQLVDERLAHAWVDEVYVGRTLRRTQRIEALLQKSGDGSLDMLRVQRLVERYQIKNTKLSPRWERPPREAPPEVQALRGKKPLNVLVYYVDTLRADVASDEKLMPATARFKRQALNFRRAYAPGSDTLRSLPAVTGGNYFTRETHEGDLCAIARRSAHESVLVIPQSAYEFIGRLRPEFSLERTIAVPDYTEGAEVWGYGADRPTAPALVDKTLEFIKNRTSKDPFFLWVFNFDQHNWRELDEAYVQEQAKEHNVSLDDQAFRYRIVASSIDKQFGRLIEGLDRLGHKNDTVVIFMSDHGEGLGQGGFWVHSVFLWDSLLRVPLAIRVPGVRPRVVDDIVSLVDVAPTLAPFLTGEENMRGYHGVDLLGYALDERPLREHPLVLKASSLDRLARIGLIDPATNLKLVVRVEAAIPELYDLSAPDPDEKNLARERPETTREMLRVVAKSPVFPRSAADFDMLLDLGPRKFPDTPLEILEDETSDEHAKGE